MLYQRRMQTKVELLEHIQAREDLEAGYLK